MEKDILWNMILREKIPYIFLSLLTENNNSYNKSIAQIHRESNITYPYLLELIHKFKLYGFLNVEKSGRTNLVALTKKGRELGVLLKQISIILKSEK